MDKDCGCRAAVFAGMSVSYKRVLWIVITINAAMFLVEMVAGVHGQSVALQADALDFLADSVTYAISLYVISKPPAWRSWAALLKALSLGLVGLWVLAWAIYNMIYMGQPVALVMTWVGAMALLANIVCALLLFRFRAGDANVRSVWICSRNDAIGNLAVIAAAGAVWLSGSSWPDLIVAVMMAALFLRGAAEISVHSWRELAKPPVPTAAGEGGQAVPSSDR